MKAVLRGKYIAWCAFNKRRKSQQLNDLILLFKALENEQINTKSSRRQTIIKIRAEINETETKEITQKIDKIKSLLFEKISIINKPLVTL